MLKKDFVPFGGVHGWLADLSIPRKSATTAASTVSYYVAESEQHRALMAIRTHAKVATSAVLVPRRALSLREVQALGMKPGQVKAA